MGHTPGEVTKLIGVEPWSSTASGRTEIRYYKKTFITLAPDGAAYNRARVTFIDEKAVDLSLSADK
jgi:hypothetical protein